MLSHEICKLCKCYISINDKFWLCGSGNPNFNGDIFPRGIVNGSVEIPTGCVYHLEQLVETQEMEADYGSMLHE